MIKVIIALMLPLAPFLFANPILPETNLREACRKQVSSHYLTVLQEKTINEKEFEFYKRQISALQKEQMTLKKQLEQLNKKEDKKNFSLDLYRQQNTVKSRISWVQTTIESSKNEIKKRQSQIIKLEARRVAIKKEISSLFKIVHMKGTPILQGISVQYRYTCPKFDSVCALPPKTRAELKANFPQPECQRYGNINF